MDMRFPYSPAEVAKVKLVQFGIISPDEIVIFPLQLSLYFVPFTYLGCRKDWKKKFGIYYDSSLDLNFDFDFLHMARVLQILNSFLFFSNSEHS